MDVKDYSQNLDKARDKYRKATNDMRSSFEKNADDVKETNDFKVKKLSKNYEAQKAKLEEENSQNNQYYSDKTKEIVSKKQEAFRNDIKKSNDKFDADRKELKSTLNDKLSNISESYNKSTAENDRYHAQAAKTMSERYSKANKDFSTDHNDQLNTLNQKSRQQITDLKEDMSKKSLHKDEEYHKDLENLRSVSQDQKFREVSRLRNDNETLRVHTAQEKNALTEQTDSQIKNILKLKNQESEEGEKNIADLQKNIREKTLAEEESIKKAHVNETKGLEQKFSDDLNRLQHMTNQKIRGANEISTLKDENKEMVASYENRLKTAKNEADKNLAKAFDKESENDTRLRENLKRLKTDHTRSMEKREADLNGQHNLNMQEVKEKTTQLADRYKGEVAKARINTEEQLSKSDSKSKNQLKDQRVQFGNFINNINDQKQEELSSIKNEFNKDKTDFIEKSRRDFSEEKNMLKDGFNRQVTQKEDLYEKKLMEVEKQTNKIIENYENRISQIARKAEKEVESVKATEAERKAKESQAQDIMLSNILRDQELEISNLRDRYEGKIGKDRIVNEQQTTRIIQKYEDQLDRERTDHQKETSLKLSESRAQFERLFKAAELEKETMRNQYEQRMENMRLAALADKGNTKKS
ncbi:MAG: hypothetical protein WC635_09835 [Bacteriovorax sp.]|jgi:hypothetical protein